jgi:hypothetical protein
MEFLAGRLGNATCKKFNELKRQVDEKAAPTNGQSPVELSHFGIYTQGMKSWSRSYVHIGIQESGLALLAFRRFLCWRWA